MWMGISITTCFILFGLLIKKSRILFMFQCLWVWILTALNNGGWDYDGNAAIYELSGKKLFTGVSGWANNLLAYFAHQMEWNYVQYNALLSTVAIIIIAYIILKYAKHPSAAISIYMIYPMMDSIYQKRFFVAMCFVLLAYSFWMYHKKLGYFVFLFIALGFHFSMLIYLFVPLIEKLIEWNNKKLIVLYVILEFMMFRYLSFFVPLIPFSGLQSKLEVYTLGQQYSSGVVGILFFLLQLFYIVIVIYIGKHWPKNEISENKINDKIYNINYTSILFLPLLLLGSTYARYFRVYQIYNFIYLGNRIDCVTWKRRNVLSVSLIRCFVIVLFFSSMVLFAVGAQGIVSAFSSVYENNLFLKQLMN